MAFSSRPDQLGPEARPSSILITPRHKNNTAAKPKEEKRKEKKQPNTLGCGVGHLPRWLGNHNQHTPVPACQTQYRDYRLSSWSVGPTIIRWRELQNKVPAIRALRQGASEQHHHHRRGAAGTFAVLKPEHRTQCCAVACYYTVLRTLDRWLHV